MHLFNAVRLHMLSLRWGPCFPLHMKVHWLTEAGTHLWNYPGYMGHAPASMQEKKPHLQPKAPPSCPFFTLQYSQAWRVTLTRQPFDSWACSVWKYWALVKVSTFLTRDNENPQTVMYSEHDQWMQHDWLLFDSRAQHLATGTHTFTDISTTTVYFQVLISNNIM